LLSENSVMKINPIDCSSATIPGEYIRVHPCSSCS
jgi:hypothetical protein